MLIYYDGITDSMGMSLSKLRGILKDKETWYAAVLGVTKSWTWFSDWITIQYFSLFNLLCIIGSRFIHLIRTESHAFLFYGWVLFHCTYIPQLLYPWMMPFNSTVVVIIIYYLEEATVLYRMTKCSQYYCACLDLWFLQGFPNPFLPFLVFKSQNLRPRA